MLDAYIIDRIRKEREPQKDGRIPLHIHVPTPPPPDDRAKNRDDESSDRGSEVVDYRM
ncbi:MAG: hypothetical protein ACJAZO_000779 [Myxococcota bacterium]|jgi:hypothetical protein